MRKFLKQLLSPILTRIASNASDPDRKLVFISLTKLLHDLKRKKTSRGIIMKVDFHETPFIIFSDHHKGNKDPSDDFAGNERNYLSALEYYYTNKFSYINLGDSEELWKYTPAQVIPKNITPLKMEDKFRESNKYIKTFGNHDLTWKNKIDVNKWFKNIFRLPLNVWEGVILTTSIKNNQLSFFLTHGHQGDRMSDNNALSTWMVSHLWRPLQRYLQINVNTPAKDFRLRDKHNMMMYDWSSEQKDLVLITGHTHKPVFASGKYKDADDQELKTTSVNSLEKIPTVKPSYFNSGCCCYNDGDITGIEISGDHIRLIKWHWLDVENKSNRVVLEEMRLDDLQREL